MTEIDENINVIKAYLKVVSESTKRDSDLDKESCWTNATDWKKDEYVQKFREKLGYVEDYWPDDVSYSECGDSVAREYALEQPTDTMAREIEGRAVMLLIRNGTENSIKMAHRLGDVLMANRSNSTKLLDLLQKTYIELLHCSHWDANEKTDDAGRDD